MPGERKILAFFVGSLAVCAALSYLIAGVGRQSSNDAPGFVNLSASAVVEIRDLSSALVLHGQFAPRPSDVHEALRVALLVAASGSAVGTAEIEQNRHPNGTLLQEVEIDVEGLPPGSAYQVVVDGRPIGSLQTDSRGAAEFERFGAVAGVPLRSGD